MTAGTLPLEIFSRILQYCRTTELPLLCRLCKSFQRVAERRLYTSLMLGDPNLAYHVCSSIVANDGVRGTYVKRFWFYTDPRRGSTRGPLPTQFWQAIHIALSYMTELKDLWIADPAGSATWILDPEDLKFQLHTARFRLAWDSYMVAFLATQPQIKHLQTLDAPDLSQVSTLPPGHLQALESFDGPLLVAAEVFSSPCLTHLRTSIDDDVFQLLPQFIEHIVNANTPLCSFHVNVILEAILPETLEALTANPKWCVRLKHLGVIVMPWKDRTIIYRHLMKLYNLQSLAFEVSHMTPMPTEIAQRAFAMEMRIYCPSLRRVAFWSGQPQVMVWLCHQNTWTHTVPRSAGQVDDHLWLSV